jgi:hypothetical protein
LQAGFLSIRVASRYAGRQPEQAMCGTDPKHAMYWLMQLELAAPDPAISCASDLASLNFRSC